MAKPISATPPVSGRDAAKIQKEIRHGTPNTDHRVQTIRRADEVYRQVKERSERAGG